jgi:acetolactate synthase regulatory subunit
MEMGGDEEGAATSAGDGGLVDASAPAPQVAEDSSMDESAGLLSRESRGKSRPQAVTAAPPAAGGGSPSSDFKQARIQETSASLVLGAKPGGVQGVADEIVAVTDRHRGFVLSSSVQATDDGGGASFELRVPSERLKAALADLSRVADVRERREAAQDITREFVSARSRLADARADRKGLLRRLARAATDLERESLKAQLRDVGSRIAAAKTDLARVNNRASYSNISVAVVGDPAAGAEENDGVWSPGDAAKDAVRVLEVVAGVLLIALAVGLPLALLAGLALILARLMQRRRRERLLDAI